LLPRDLTRPKAKELIAAHLAAGVSGGKLAGDRTGALGDTVTAGILEQIWTVPQEAPSLANLGKLTILQLTPKGRLVFSRVGVSRLIAVWESDVQLAKPLKQVVIDVTGVRQAQSEDARVAEFTWKTEGDATALRYLGFSTDPAAGQATFQRYDDGWRLTHIDATPQAFVFVHDPQAEAVGRAALAEQRRTEEAHVQAEQQRLAQRREEAMVPTREIGTFVVGRREDGCCNSGKPNGYLIVEGTLKLTDADLTFTPSGVGPLVRVALLNIASMDLTQEKASIYMFDNVKHPTFTIRHRDARNEGYSDGHYLRFDSDTVVLMKPDDSEVVTNVARAVQEAYDAARQRFPDVFPAPAHAREGGI
jgi:hypothetical protein